MNSVFYLRSTEQTEKLKVSSTGENFRSNSKVSSTGENFRSNSKSLSSTGEKSKKMWKTQSPRPVQEKIKKTWKTQSLQYRKKVEKNVKNSKYPVPVLREILRKKDTLSRVHTRKTPTPKASDRD